MVERRGKQELKGFLGSTFTKFPDFGRAEIKLRFGSVGSYEWVLTGTHMKALPGIPPTGKKFSVRGTSIIELQAGKIMRNSDYWNLASMLVQLG